MGLASRYNRLGLQRRVMLYVTGGLVVMFSLLVVLGIRSINQATDLVFQERLSAARTTSVLLERDMLHIVADIQSEGPALNASYANGTVRDESARLLDHLTMTDSFAFFHATGVWLLDGNGRLVSEVGAPRPASREELLAISDRSTDVPVNGYAFLPAFDSNAESSDVGFVSVMVRVDSGSGSPLFAVCHISSDNSASAYVPSSYGFGHQADAASDPLDVTENYHLEVINSTGLVVLGIGEDERPGEMSPHYRPLRRAIEDRKAIAIRHNPSSGETFEPHVMAVVPLESAGLTVVLEQPIDVALALPNELRGRLILWSSVGFAVALVIAWITTRHVVKPTEQLTLAAERMAAGDLSSPVDVPAQDEIGKLAVSVEAMRRQTSEAYATVERANKELEVRVKERTARLGELLSRIISAQEDERQRVARELHDETAQNLGALSMVLDRARDRLPDDAERTGEHINQAREISTQLIEETRRLILDLRPMVLDDMGLAPAIRWYAENHLEEEGIETEILVDQPVTRLPAHMEVSLFRMIQEAINNVARHSGAAHARVELTFHDSHVRAVIEDDGDGFDVEAILDGEAKEKSVGLLGMQERASLLGGQVSIESKPGQGTKIDIGVPLFDLGTPRS